jgi:hypothetical protein
MLRRQNIKETGNVKAKITPTHFFAAFSRHIYNPLPCTLLMGDEAQTTSCVDISAREGWKYREMSALTSSFRSSPLRVCGDPLLDSLPNVKFGMLVIGALSVREAKSISPTLPVSVLLRSGGERKIITEPEASGSGFPEEEPGWLRALRFARSDMTYLNHRCESSVQLTAPYLRFAQEITSRISLATSVMQEGSVLTGMYTSSRLSPGSKV